MWICTSAWVVRCVSVCIVWDCIGLVGHEYAVSVALAMFRSVLDACFFWEDDCGCASAVDVSIRVSQIKHDKSYSSNVPLCDPASISHPSIFPAAAVLCKAACMMLSLWDEKGCEIHRVTFGTISAIEIHRVTTFALTFLTHAAHTTNPQTQLLDHTKQLTQLSTPLHSTTQLLGLLLTTCACPVRRLSFLSYSSRTHQTVASSTASRTASNSSRTTTSTSPAPHTAG